MTVLATTVKRSAINEALKRSEQDRREMWDTYPHTDRLYDQLDSQLTAIEVLREANARAAKLMQLAVEQLSAMNGAHDSAVTHLVKALAEAAGELS